MKKVSNLNDLEKGQILYNKRHGMYWVAKVKLNTSNIAVSVDVLSLETFSSAVYCKYEASDLMREDTYIVCGSAQLHKAITNKFDVQQI